MPLIHVMKHGTSAQAAIVRHAIEVGGRDDFAAVMEAIKSSGALEETRRYAAAEADLAIAALECVPASNFKTRCYNCRTLQLPGLTSRVCNERGIAQPGRALRSGRRGRRFESSFPTKVSRQKCHSSEWLFVCRSAIGSRQPCPRRVSKSSFARFRKVLNGKRLSRRGPRLVPRPRCNCAGAAAADASRRGSKMPSRDAGRSSNAFTRPFPAASVLTSMIFGAILSGW